MTLRETLENGEPLNEMERAALVSMLEEREHLKKWARIGKRLTMELPSIVNDDLFEFPVRPRGGR